MNASMPVTPWWSALTLREEILSASGQIDDVQMSLFRAVHSRGADTPPYADATYYGEITHPTERLTDLLAEIAVRIGGGDNYLKARAVTRLDQGMGGGKSHACIGAFHLAASSKALFATELGQRIAVNAKGKIGTDLRPDLNRPHVVVLPCDNMTPAAPVLELDGPAVTLFERFLWRLFAGDATLFEEYRPYWSDKSKISAALKAVRRPVLIIVDEIVDYIGNGLDGAQRPDLAAQDIAFIRALLDVVNDVPHVAMLVVMIASDRDKTALSHAAQARRDDVNSLLERNGTPATVTEVGDFADILRRRLFSSEPPRELLTATADLYSSVLSDRSWTKHVWDPIGSSWRERWRDEVITCYPFHPMLMALAREEWSKVTGFQRVRSTIRIFAASVYAQQQRGKRGEWVPALIGPGDLPLSVSSVREALLGSGLVEDERTSANYRSLAEMEVVNNDGSAGIARRQDIDRDDPLWRDSNPRAAERAATFVFLASIVGTLRPGRGRGASAPEVKAATSVPDLAYTVTDADTVLDELLGAERGMSAVEVVPGQGNNKPARYFLSTRLTYRMLVGNIRRTITETERDIVIAEFAERLSSSGPFREKRFIEADITREASEVLATTGIDRAHINRLIILDPAQFSLRNGMEESTRQALAMAMGLSDLPKQVPVQWASSAVFGIVNTQRRALVRGLAVEYLARFRALAAPEVQADIDLKSTGTRELAAARQQLEKAIKRAFQHVAYLAQPDPDGQRSVEVVTFDDEHSSALDGTIVWKDLVQRDKVFDDRQFSARALVHNLRDGDYSRTLSDIRAAFYSAPRLPLLYAGDRDLQQAIFDAVTADLLQIVDGSGTPVAVTTPMQINLASTGLRLVRPRASEESDQAENGFVAGGDERNSEIDASEVSDGRDSPTVSERRVAFAFTSNLLTSDPDALASLFRALYVALDERDLSYIQGTLQLVLETTTADRIVQQLEEMGVRSTSTDL